MRNRQQIVDLIEDADDLEMLFAISIAYAKSIDERWGMEIADGKDALVNEIMKLKKP